RTRPHFAGQPMLDSVFDEGLQDERRYWLFCHPGIEVETSDEPIAEPHPFDFEVFAQKVNLFANRNHVALGPDHYMTKDVGKALGHCLSLFRLGSDQIEDRVEGVEQEMRVQLCPQCLKVGFSQQLAQSRLAQLALAHLAVKAKRLDSSADSISQER